MDGRECPGLCLDFRKTVHHEVDCRILAVFLLDMMAYRQSHRLADHVRTLAAAGTDEPLFCHGRPIGVAVVEDRYLLAYCQFLRHRAIDAHARTPLNAMAASFEVTLAGSESPAAAVGNGFIGIHGFELPDAIEEDEPGSRHCSDGMNAANDDWRRSRWAELAVAVNLVGSDWPIGARRRWVFADSLCGRWSTRFRCSSDVPNLVLCFTCFAILT
ncbi:hypothetical protein ACLOJK_037065 [Asimina triloba]